MPNQGLAEGSHAAAAVAERETDRMVWVPGAAFTLGSDWHYPEEGPAHRIHVDGFWMDAHAVTNRDFAAFVEATGYVTVAERPLRPADYPGVAPQALVSGSAVFRPPPGPVDLRGPATWWQYCAGASWRRPEGPGST